MSTTPPTRSVPLTSLKSVTMADLAARWLDFQTDLVIDGFGHWTDPADAIGCPSIGYSCVDTPAAKSA